MNVSAAKTPDTTAKTETVNNDNALKKTQETEAANQNKEISEKKDDSQKKESEFKKLLEPQETDKLTEQQQLLQQNQQNQDNLNQNYINQFSFDVGSINAKHSLSMNFDTASISKDDAKFFSDLVENKQFAVQDNNGKTNIIKFADEIGPTYKTQQASKTLAGLIEKAYKGQQPVRIDFDNNVSVIMKIDKSGKITAEFIPGDKAVEEYLRNNIRSLKQRFDEENIGYNDLFYRQSKNQNQQQQKRNKGE